ncbi:EpsG family [Caulobacteraceae bacterium]
MNNDGDPTHPVARRQLASTRFRISEFVALRGSASGIQRSAFSGNTRVGRPSDQPKRRLAIHAIVYIAFAALFLFFPWEELRNERWIDRYRYALNFYNLNTVGGAGGSLLDLWKAEPAWQWLVTTLYKMTSNIDLTLTLVSAAALVCMLAFMKSNPRAILFLPILISPNFIDLIFSQTRSALGFSLVYVAMIKHRRLLSRAVSVLPAALGVFMHQIVLPLVTVVFVHRIVSRARMSPFVRVGLLAAPPLILVLLLTVFREQALGAIGDRRAYTVSRSSSIALAVMLTSFVAPLLRRWTHVLHSPSAYLSICMAFTAFCLELSGQSGGPRMMALAMPALAVALSEIREVKVRNWSLGYILFCNALYFSYWL